MQILLKHSRTGELRNVKVGWSWALFFFSSFLGLPLFLRGLTAWGVLMAALWGLSLLSAPVLPEESVAAVVIPLWLVSTGLAVFFGMKGNEMTAKNYLERGYEFAEPQRPEVTFAKGKWGLAA